MMAEAEDNQTPATSSQTNRMARMGDRVFAVFLDLIILLPLFWLAGAAIGVANGVYNGGNATLVGGPALLVFLLITIIWIVYYTVAEFFFAGSPGKCVMGIEVVSQRGGRISLMQSVLRNLLRPLDAIGLYALGFIVALCSRQRKRIGDFVAKTLVCEKVDSRRLMALAVLIALLAASNCAALVFYHFAR
jgi:uncharacterized RDD family membrane protein YckC